MKKYTLGMLFMFLFPLFALASWWNPFTWRLPVLNPKAVQEVISTSTVEKSSSIKPVVTTITKAQTKAPEKTVATPPPIQKNLTNDQICQSTQGANSIFYKRTEGTFICTCKSGYSVSNGKCELNQTYTNTSAENITKQNAINVYNQVITSYSSLYTYLNSAVNIMANMETQMSYLTNNPYAKIIEDMSYEERQVFLKGIGQTRQVINLAQAKLQILQSQPLSYFSTYQISTDPDDPYSALNTYQKAVDGFVEGYNNYLSVIQKSYIQTSIPTVSQPIHCTFQSPGVIGGSGSISCY